MQNFPPSSTTSKSSLPSSTSKIPPQPVSTSQTPPLATQSQKPGGLPTTQPVPQKTWPTPFRERKPQKHAASITTTSTKSAAMPSQSVPVHPAITQQSKKPRLPSLAEKYGSFPNTNAQVSNTATLSTHSQSVLVQPALTQQPKKPRLPSLVEKHGSFSNTQERVSPSTSGSQPLMTSSKSLQERVLSFNEQQPPKFQSMGMLPQSSKSAKPPTPSSKVVGPPPFGMVSNISIIPSSDPPIEESRPFTTHVTGGSVLENSLSAFGSEQAIDDPTHNNHGSNSSSAFTAGEPTVKEPSVQEKECTRKRKLTTKSKPSKTNGAKSSKASKDTEDWPEDVQFDPKEEVMTIDKNGNRQSKGGSIQPRDVDNEDGLRYIVEFNEHNQPLRKGGSILVRYLGKVANTERFCPIGVDTWHKVSAKFKADIIKLLESKFVLPDKDIIYKKALGLVAKTWRNYKYSLKKTHFNLEKRTKQQIYDDVPKGHTSTQWVNLVDYWCSKRFQKLSECGKEARGSLNHFHTTGSTSYANIRADFEREKGRKASFIEFWEKTHETKEGVVNDLSGKFLEVAKSKVDECAKDSFKSRVQIENEVFKELMCDEKSKRPIGFGYGVNKSVVFGVHAELIERGFRFTDDETSIQADNIKTELIDVTKRSKVLEERNQALEEKNQALEKKNEVLGATVNEHNEILKQLLFSVRNGHLSEDFFKTSHSFLCREKSEVHDVSSGNGTRNGSGDITQSP